MESIEPDYYQLLFVYSHKTNYNETIPGIYNHVASRIYTESARTTHFLYSSRDRMVRVETKVEAMQSQINRLEDKFDSYFMWGFGLVLMSIFGLIGFIIYDRRTTLAPVENKTERILKVLKEAAEKDPILREALKRTALW